MNIKGVSKMEVVKVHVRTDGIKYCIVPKKSNIGVGDLVLITNNLNLIKNYKKEEEDGRKK